MGLIYILDHNDAMKRNHFPCYWPIVSELPMIWDATRLILTSLPCNGCMGFMSYKIDLKQASWKTLYIFLVRLPNGFKVCKS